MTANIGLAGIRVPMSQFPLHENGEWSPSDHAGGVVRNDGWLHAHEARGVLLSGSRLHLVWRLKPKTMRVRSRRSRPPDTRRPGGASHFGRELVCLLVPAAEPKYALRRSKALPCLNEYAGFIAGHAASPNRRESRKGRARRAFHGHLPRRGCVCW